MSESFLKNIILPAVIIVAGFAAIFWLTRTVEESRPQLSAEYSDSDLAMNGASVKGFAFGAEGLIADWYFMRALQYIGDKLVQSKEEVINLDDLRSLNPRLLHPLLDNAVELDPHFIGAYSYGALVLPAIDAEKAIALAKKGIDNNPSEWRLYQYLGFIYWKLGRYDEAAEVYQRGSEIAGASPFMKMMSANMKDEGGSRETARAIYREMYNGTTDEGVRITAERRLNDLDSLDEREAIDRVLTEFKEKNGRCATSFNEILSLLSSVKLPNGRDFRVDRANNIVDPTGKPYQIDKENCRVKTDLK